jgi:peptidoglycan/LPS O-acetylase OafA/YrhL
MLKIAVGRAIQLFLKRDWIMRGAKVHSIKRAESGASNPVTGGHRFVFLDGLRGMAAICVLVFHIVQQQSLTALPNAGLAVDFFYVLSGFVIAFAYDQRIRDGSLSLRQFGLARLRRLYPLLALATLLGFVIFLGGVFIKHTVTLRDALFALVLALMLLPSYVFPQWATAFPLNMAAWSLAFEAYVNIIYATIAKRLSNNILSGLVALGAALEIANAVRLGGISGGNDQGNFVLGFARVIYPFFCLILICRLPRRQELPRFIGYILAISLPIVLLAEPTQNQYYGMFLVLFYFPALVYFGSVVEVNATQATVLRWLGEISYPVYILQAPVIRLGAEILRHVKLSYIAVVSFSVAEILLSLAVAQAAVRYFDRPVQEYLKKRVR